MSTTIKSFKVSELPEIPDVDGNDLLMVSEHESGNKYMTKKMSISQITNHITHILTPAIETLINQAIQSALSGDIQDIVDNAVNAAMSGDEFDQKIVQTLDKVSDGKIDDIILVDGNSINDDNP